METSQVQEATDRIVDVPILQHVMIEAAPTIQTLVVQPMAIRQDVQAIQAAHTALLAPTTVAVTAAVIRVVLTTVVAAPATLAATAAVAHQAATAAVVEAEASAVVAVVEAVTALVEAMDADNFKSILT